MCIYIYMHNTIHIYYINTYIYIYIYIYMYIHIYTICTHAEVISSEQLLSEDHVQPGA